ncbi:MAG: bifunctional phosphopantothenoylcysteine decarboxylase/phosphopantothenate--cysteine ligase CoaBC [Bacteroidota bacterium]
MLKGKKILLGVTGSIAAYKSALLVRLLKKEGAEVQVVMTDAAKDFITPLTLATLSEKPALSEFSESSTGIWNNHVDLGLWADLILVAPATADTLAKSANGICDNLLQACYLSARCPVFFAPAMDLDMFSHPSTQANIRKLESYGNIIIDAESGELASGLEGKGRMAEPENILEELKSFAVSDKRFEGKNILITAGPTYEPIDPVRFIGNHSSGKMGYAIAETLAEWGAHVNLVTGPTSLNINHPRVSVTKVQSAEDMYNASTKYFETSQIAVLAAAVADYTPQKISKQKIKKKSDSLQLDLVKTHDIAASLGKIKKEDQLIVGFALETENEFTNASEKLRKKNFDLVVLNSLNDKGAGFSYDTNKISIIGKNGVKKDYDLKPKKEVARDIANSILGELNHQ